MTRLRLLLPFVALLGTATAQTHRDVRVPIRDGKVSVLELSRALLEEYGFASEHVTFPDFRLDVTGAKGLATVLGIDRALGDTASLRKVDGGETLRIRIDRAEVRAARRKVKRRLGRALSALVGKDLLARHYELDLPEGLATDETFVLAVHGLDSGSRHFRDLGPAIAPTKFGCFSYANDEAIDRIAGELSRRLKAQHAEFPDRDIVIVAHSMGGLVARCMVENPDLDPGNVTKVILVGTPNLGSQLAYVRNGNDVLEFMRDHGDVPRVLGPWLDGLGEAGWDLRPNSVFLTELNARDRNPNVEYHVVLGDRALVDAEKLVELRASLLAQVAKWEKSDVYEPRLRAWLEDLDEVVHGRGDGAVSLERGRLEGVEPMVVPLGHRQLLRAAPEGQEQPVFEAIRGWIR